MNKSKVAVSIAVITLSIRIVVGFILTLFGLVGAVAVSETDGISAIMMLVILFSVPGILISISGFKCRKRIGLFKKYVAILANDESGSISNLARETNTSENIVQANLQKMIDKHYFSNAHIDYNMNCVVFRIVFQLLQVLLTAHLLRVLEKQHLKFLQLPAKAVVRQTKWLKDW